MPNGHKRGQPDPTASLALRKERNKRYYASRRAAIGLLKLATTNQPHAAPTTTPTTTTPTESSVVSLNDGTPTATASVKLPEAPAPTKMDDTMPEICHGASTEAHTCKKGRTDPTASVALRKERNKRYYAKRKAAKQSPSAQPTTTTPLEQEKKRQNPAPPPLSYRDCNPTMDARNKRPKNKPPGWQLYHSLFSASPTPTNTLAGKKEVKHGTPDQESTHVSHNVPTQPATTCPPNLPQPAQTRNGGQPIWRI